MCGDYGHSGDDATQQLAEAMLSPEFWANVFSSRTPGAQVRLEDIAE